jgi:hypothetical protein
LPTVLAIHAAKRFDRNVRGMCLGEPFRSVLAKRVDALTDLPFGAVVAVVRLVECVSTNFLPIHGSPRVVPCLAAKYLDGPNERAFGDYSVGRYAWAFDQRLLLEKPVPMVGHQGIWQWEDAPADVLQWCEIAVRTGT